LYDILDPKFVSVSRLSILDPKFVSVSRLFILDCLCSFL
jgi:hypothetical protein